MTDTEQRNSGRTHTITLTAIPGEVRWECLTDGATDNMSYRGWNTLGAASGAAILHVPVGEAFMIHGVRVPVAEDPRTEGSP